MVALLVLKIAGVTVRAARFLVAAADGLRVRAAAITTRLQLAASRAVVALATISAVHGTSLDLKTQLEHLPRN